MSNVRSTIENSSHLETKRLNNFNNESDHNNPDLDELKPSIL